MGAMRCRPGSVAGRQVIWTVLCQSSCAFAEAEEPRNRTVFARPLPPRIFIADGAVRIAFQTALRIGKHRGRKMRPYFGTRTVDLMAARTAFAVSVPLAAGNALATWFEGSKTADVAVLAGSCR
jgi:hypothetical protein